MRKALALACLVAGITAASAEAPLPKLLLEREDPVSSFLTLADADGDGIVTRTELDAAVEKASLGAEGDFQTVWHRKLEVYGLPPDSGSLDIKAIFKATLRMCSEADADGDGDVTPPELKAYAMSRPQSLRADTITAILAFDRNVDMTVSAAELKASEAAFEAEAKALEKASEKEREASLSPARASRLASWVEATRKVTDAATSAWQAVAADGRAGLDKLLEKVSDDAR